MKRAFAFLLFCASPLFSQQPQKVTPPKSPACDTASVIAKARPIFGVGDATIAKACPALRDAITLNYGAMRALFPAGTRVSIEQVDTLVMRWTGLKPVVAVTPPVAQPPVVTPPTPVVVTPPVVQPPVVTPPSSPGVIFSHDFNDGAAGPFGTNVPWDTPPNRSLRAIDDPTGSNRGKVLAVRYADAGPNADINRYLDPVVPASAFGYGQTLWFSGEVYFPAGTANWTDGGVQRKLVYMRNDSPANPLLYVTLRLFGNRPSIEWVHLGGAAASRSTDFADVALNLGQWYRIEIEVKAESQAGLTNGAIRVYLDGKQIYEHAATGFSASGETRPLRFNRFWVGAQREGSDNSGGAAEFNIDETRYWDNVAFSTARIRP